MQREIFRAEEGNSFWWEHGTKLLSFFGVDGVLRRHQVLRSDNRRRRLYLNEQVPTPVLLASKANLCS